MKINFESQFNRINKKENKPNFPWSKKLKNLLIGSGLFIMSTLPIKAESSNLKTDPDDPKIETVDMYKRFQEVGAIPREMTIEDFLKLDEKFIQNELIPKFIEKTGYLTKEEVLSKYPDAKIVKKIKHTIEETKTEERKLVNTISFNNWFNEQIKNGNEGKIMTGPDGKKYKITIDENADNKLGNRKIGEIKTDTIKTTKTQEYLAKDYHFGEKDNN